jgi:hypothetical protein
MTPLEEQVALVAHLRADQAASTARLNELKNAFAAEHHDEIWQTQMHAQDLVMAETKLREMTLAAYAETGEKKPAGGVAVQLRNRLKYDRETAVRWAVYTGRPQLLSLRRDEFETVAKGYASANEPLEFVERVQEPAATIATDLSAFATDAPTEALEAPF